MRAATGRDGDRLRADVERLAVPAGRMVGTAGHDAARLYLLDRMGEVGLEPYGGSYAWGYESADGLELTNLLGVVHGEDPDAAPLVLAAHYDTCGAMPGADDNAAAVAILLDAIPRLRDRRLPRPVLCAFFDAEEPPYFLGGDMGSVRFYRDQRLGPVHGAIVMDLCGHDVPVSGLEDLLFLTGMESDPGWRDVVAGGAERTAQRVVPVLNRYVGDMSDHHAFRLDRRPYLFLTCAHWEHYHAPSDTPEKLNYDKMAAIASFVVETADGAARSPLSGPFEGWDTTPVELDYMRRAFGPVLAPLGLQLESRADIEIAVVTMMREFGL